jgi:hypothetical protein
MEKLKCKRCGHEWWPRHPKKKPLCCPLCKNPNWDTKKPVPKYMQDKK